MLQTNVKEAIELLIVSGYLLIDPDGHFQLTTKWFELDSDGILAKAPTTREIIRLDGLTKNAIPNPGEQSLLIKFIIDCEVPQKIKAADGKSYWASKYNKEAEKELAKLMAQGYQMDILVAATKLYYKGAGFCEAISNFICRGTWLTHYNEMAGKLAAGAASTHKYIQETLEEKGGSPIYDER